MDSNNSPTKRPTVFIPIEPNERFRHAMVVKTQFSTYRIGPAGKHGVRDFVKNGETPFKGQVLRAFTGEPLIANVYIDDSWRVLASSVIVSVEILPEGEEHPT